MKILTQDRKILLDTDYIWTSYNRIYATTRTDQPQLLAEYEDFSFTKTRTLNGTMASDWQPYTVKEEAKMINAGDICKKVFEKMITFFEKNEGSIFVIPTQKDMENKGIEQ